MAKLISHSRYSMSIYSRGVRFRVLRDDLAPGTDSLHGSTGRNRALLRKETAEALKVVHRGPTGNFMQLLL